MPCHFPVGESFVRFGQLWRALALYGMLSAAQFAAGQHQPGTLRIDHPVQDKNFYLFSLLENDAATRDVIDKELNAITTERRNALASARRICKSDVACALKAFLWTDEEIYTVSLSLDHAAQTNPAVERFIERKLLPSRTYILFENLPRQALLVRAWEICARGMNEAISVYGEGLAPRYPAIDSISADLQSPDFQQRVLALAAQYAQQDFTTAPFFEPSLRVALALLELNHRDEAGRFEPLESGPNRAAVEAIAAIDWHKYAYSAIVVPGAGGSDYITPLSAAGHKRCALAADAYHTGKAPLLIVSGGYVHPSQTHFAEATEMKRALMADFGVPESAILVDPHARHTTTNLRNAAREIFRYGIPARKPVLVVSDASQIRYIASQDFAGRCLKELGYMPYRLVRNESDTALVIEPSIEALEQDPIDPLDP
jgi:hypothetical protein